MVADVDRVWDQLTAAQQRDLRILAGAPLASAGDLAGFLAQTDTGVHRRLRTLSEMGLVDSERLGVIGESTDRWFITEEAQRVLRLTGKTWHQPGCLGRLLERLVAVEWLYRAAARVDCLGEMQEWQWVDGVSFDAVSRHSIGWVAWFWFGQTKVGTRIAELFEQVGNDLEALRIGGDRPRPSLLGVLVWDRWQVETVLSCARQFGIEDWVLVWSIQDDTWLGASAPLPSAGWVSQPPYRRDSSWESWKRRVLASPWSERGRRDPVQWLRRVSPTVKSTLNGVRCVGLIDSTIRSLRKVDDVDTGARIIENASATATREYGNSEAAEILKRVAGYLRSGDGPRDMVRVLFWVTEWPGVTVPMLQAVLGETRSGRRAQRTCIRLVDLGLVVRWRDGNSYRYRASENGVKMVARMDRTAWEHIWKRIQMDRWADRKGFLSHEYGLLDLIHQFVAAGCAVANGWRMWEPLGSQGGIAPDAAVFLRESPLTAGWHYAEFERRAKSRWDMEKKLRGYESSRRHDAFPLLIVCANEAAETNAQNWALQNRVQLATTTIQRWREHGAVGNPDCWIVARLPASSDEL